MHITYVTKYSPLLFRVIGRSGSSNTMDDEVFSLSWFKRKLCLAAQDQLLLFSSNFSFTFQLIVPPKLILSPGSLYFITAVSCPDFCRKKKKERQQPAACWCRATHHSLKPENSLQNQIWARLSPNMTWPLYIRAHSSYS